MVLPVPQRKLYMSKQILSHLTDITATDSLPIRTEYKLWICIKLYNIIDPVLFVSWCCLSWIHCKLGSIATQFLKKCHRCHFDASCPSISRASRGTKPSLLACVSSSSDLQLQELNLQLWLGNTALKIVTTPSCLLLICDWLCKRGLIAFPNSKFWWIVSPKPSPSYYTKQ